MKNLYFIYGTLKKKMKNEHIMKKVNGEFIEKVKTKIKYPMFDLLSGFPYIQDKKGYGLIVKGELYKIDEQYIKKLDEFEGVPTLYKRGKINVKSKEKNYKNVNCYFISSELTINELTKVDLFEEWVE